MRGFATLSVPGTIRRILDPVGLRVRAPNARWRFGSRGDVGPTSSRLRSPTRGDWTRLAAVSLQALRIQNLRCLSDTGRIPIRPITLLVGRK